MVHTRLSGVCGDAAADAMMAMNDNAGSATGTPERVIERMTKLARPGLRVRHLLFQSGV